MKRIVNSREMKMCDSTTINHFCVPSLVLMERAALSIVQHMPYDLSHGGRILIVCGNGNNGADGLAAARLLHQQGCSVTVSQMPDSGNRSQENKQQLQILAAYGIPVRNDLPDDDKYDGIIDALFGIGLSREPKKEYADWIVKMNRMNGYKIAADMPSGVSSDTGRAYDASFEADLTVTFAYQKAGQILYPGCEKCGRTVTAEIGITDESWLNCTPSCYALEKEDLKNIPKRPARSNKGTFGKVLVMAGSRNMAGAALFSAQAAYRTGCGLVEIVTPEDNRIILQSSLPEAVFSCYSLCSERTDENAQRAARAALHNLLAREMERADVIVLGPGIGTGMQARWMVSFVLENARVPVVLDADGLNIAAEDLTLLERTQAQLIITPHLGEMARLCRQTISEIKENLVGTAAEFARRYHLTCVLKDAVTITAAEDGTTYLNTSGCSAMAKGGSGDVLTGIIAALLAQGMKIPDAAAMGVYVHGLAGEAAARKEGDYSVLARDIIQAAGSVLAGREDVQAG